MANDKKISKLSIIIPCYNEEGNFSRYTKEFFPFFESLPFAKEYIFVDDGSSDQTLNRLEDLDHQYEGVVVVQHPKNLGMGMALRSGFAKVTGDAVLTVDSDLTFHPNEFSHLLKAFSGEAACVTGSAMMGKFESVAFYRRFLSQSVNRIYQLLLGQRITSTSSIFRLYRSKDLRELQLDSTSFNINAEIIAKLILKKKGVIEVPVTLQTRTWGKSKINLIREIKNHLVLFGKIMVWRWAS